MDQSPETGAPQPQPQPPCGRRAALQASWEGWVRELPIFVTLAVLFLGAVAAAVVFGVRDYRSDARCSDVQSVNRGEQRVCQPHRTGDVKLSPWWPNLTAYRYAVGALPETVQHTTHEAHNQTLSPYAFTASNFTLSAGGPVEFAFRTAGSDVASAYLMSD